MRHTQRRTNKHIKKDKNEQGNTSIDCDEEAVDLKRGETQLYGIVGEKNELAFLLLQPRA